MKVNVLGTEYDMQVKGKAEDDTLVCADGYCQNYSKKIVIKRTEDMLDGDASIDAKKSRNEQVKRHELVHAFLFESGLDDRLLFKHQSLYGHLRMWKIYANTGISMVCGRCRSQYI